MIAEYCANATGPGSALSRHWITGRPTGHNQSAEWTPRPRFRKHEIKAGSMLGYLADGGTVLIQQ